MKQEAISPQTAIRRCPNCGTRVAQGADTCYFCGFDLTKVPKARRRITWVDLALVLVVLLVVIIWWQVASGPESAPGEVVAPTPLVAESADAPAADEAGIADDAIPVAVPTVNAAGTAANPFVVAHTVLAGETLVGIAERYGVTVESIQAANELSGTVIRSGDELLIPVPEVITESGSEMTVPSTFTYVVQPGDTVVSIAIRFGTQVDAILSANDLGQEDFIRPNQRLVIPVDQVPSAVLASSDVARGMDQSELARYEAPRLIGPQDGESFPIADEILFRWISVDLLAPNEWYVLRVWPLAGTTQLPPPVWTKTTSYRLDEAWAPTNGQARYGWQVTVVRVLPDQGSGREIQAASAPSEVRTFTWQ